MSETENKFQVFLEVAKVLNSKLDLAPVLYGSLGLNKLIGKVGEVHDIDILVPDEYLMDKWEQLKATTEDAGFRLSDLKDHKFEREGSEITYEKTSGLAEIPGFDPSLIEEVICSDIKFKQLTPQNYLDLYLFLEACEWRHEAGKRPSDLKKIAAIRRYIASKS